MGLLDFIKKTLSCEYCGYIGGDFKKIEKNMYKCPACTAITYFGFSNEEENLLSIAKSDLRRQEFLDAEEKFLDIIEKFPNNYEAYFGYVSSKYGVKHEEDYNGKIIPTCCLDSISSFKDDSYFKKAVSLAPKEISEFYISQADYLERINKKWLEEVEKEKPYDIFISYKDSDKEKGIDRTKDSFDASDLYAYLVNKGYRVFFSRISLQDKTGDKYEPYIFNALKTAKVMIIFGSKKEYINSTWVKNEWHRFIKRISLGEKKENSIIVCYKDFNINELPSILSSKQCLDYSSNMFYLNLQNYLDKFFDNINKKEEIKSNINSKSETITPITKKEKPIFTEEHIHNYKINHIIKPSCISRGYTIHKCECGDEYKDSFTSLSEHEYKLDKKTRETCATNGEEIYICAVCGNKDIKTIPSTGHNFTNWEVDKDKKTETRYCKNCGIEEKRDALSSTVDIPKNVKIGDIITLGSYPQTDVTKTMSNALSSYVSLLPTESDSNGWISYKYYIDGSNKKDYMWYKDFIHTDGNKYRAVYFTQYRPYLCNCISTADNSNQDKNGYFINTLYLFKYEPIKWSILSEKDGKVLIVANLILDSQEYYPINNTFKFSHNGGTGYANNYELSMIRKFLNDNFYNIAFNEYQKSIIELITINNHAKSTGHLFNKYACSNTQDKLFLLSYKEATTYYNSYSARIAYGTDYAKAQGLYAYNSASGWWLRSPNDYGAYYAYSVSNGGYLGGSDVSRAGSGVRPACYIKIK